MKPTFGFNFSRGRQGLAFLLVAGTFVSLVSTRNLLECYQCTSLNVTTGVTDDSCRYTPRNVNTTSVTKYESQKSWYGRTDYGRYSWCVSAAGYFTNEVTGKPEPVYLRYKSIRSDIRTPPTGAHACKASKPPFASGWQFLQFFYECFCMWPKCNTVRERTMDILYGRKVLGYAPKGWKRLYEDWEDKDEVAEEGSLAKVG